MESYDQERKILLKERTKLEQKLSETLSLLSIKEQEKIRIEQELDNLIKELDKLKNIQNKMSNNKKIALSPAIISTFLTALIGVLLSLYFLSNFIATPVRGEKGLYLLAEALGIPSIMLITFITTLKISKVIFKNKTQKIKKSVEYKEISEKISMKEMQINNVKSIKDKISNDYLELLLESGRLSAAVKLKTETVTLIYNNYYSNKIDESISVQKPYTRVKTK